MFTVREFILPNFNNTDKLSINGRNYTVPVNPSDTLVMLYGEDFMTPKKNANATKSVNKHIKVHDINKYYGIGYINS